LWFYWSPDDLAKIEHSKINDMIYFTEQDIDRLIEDDAPWAT
jgi:hypothetical protein